MIPVLSPSTGFSPLNSAATACPAAAPVSDSCLELPAASSPELEQRLVQPVPVYVRREVGSVPFSFSSLPKHGQGDLPAMPT